MIRAPQRLMTCLLVSMGFLVACGTSNPSPVTTAIVSPQNVDGVQVGATPLVPSSVGVQGTSPGTFATEAGKSTPGGENKTPETASLEWKQRGGQIIAERQKALTELQAHQGNAKEVAAAAAVNPKEGAYLSNTIDIGTPGTYPLHWKVPVGFKEFPKDGGPISYSFTFPGDMKMTAHTEPPFNRSAANGGYFDLSANLVVVRVDQKYPGFSLWIY